VDWRGEDVKYFNLTKGRLKNGTNTQEVWQRTSKRTVGQIRAKHIQKGSHRKTVGDRTKPIFQFAQKISRQP
jgi:hypothetical protein